MSTECNSGKHSAPNEASPHPSLNVKVSLGKILNCCLDFLYILSLNPGCRDFFIFSRDHEGLPSLNKVGEC